MALKEWIIIGMLVLGVNVVSGCAHKQLGSVPCGVEDYVFIPKESKLANVPLPTDENKTYTVVTKKDGFWISKDCDSRRDI